MAQDKFRIERRTRGIFKKYEQDDIYCLASNGKVLYAGFFIYNTEYNQFNLCLFEKWSIESLEKLIPLLKEREKTLLKGNK